MSETHSFQEMLKIGEEWEERLQPIIKDQVTTYSIERMSFDENPKKQLSGIDHAITQDDFSLDVKIRANKYCCDDVFIETVSVEEKDDDGWLYNDETDVIAYCWLNRVGDNLADGILLSLDDEFVEWFESVKSRFHHKRVESEDEDTGETWHTIGCIVPISSILSPFINTDFNPELPTDLVTDQEKLSKWSND